MYFSKSTEQKRSTFCMNNKRSQWILGSETKKRGKKGRKQKLPSYENVAYTRGVLRPYQNSLCSKPRHIVQGSHTPLAPCSWPCKTEIPAAIAFHSLMELLSSTGNPQQHVQELPNKRKHYHTIRVTACTGGHRADSLSPSPADSGKLSWLMFRWGL